VLLRWPASVTGERPLPAAGLANHHGL